MAKLTDEIRTFIVSGLACFDTSATIIAGVRQQFGVQIDRFQVRDYSPDAAKPPARRWRQMHEQIRAAFVEKQAGIAVTSKAVRLRRLERMADRAEERGNFPLAAALLEQAAKECGDVFSNKVKHKHEGTGPDGQIEYRTVVEFVEPNG
jgi:hypothetical protein